MHQTRAETSTKLPIKRKGTKYVARALNDLKNGVPVLIALRDMLGLARTAKEAKEEINRKQIKINGRIVRDKRENIKLFNIFEADKKYKLTLLQIGKFAFEETRDDFRVCKIVKKTIVKGGKIQLTMHDGTNILDDGKNAIWDSVEIGFDGRVRKKIEFKKGAEAMAILGKNMGTKGKIEEVLDDKIKIDFGGRVVEMKKSHAMLI